MKNIIFVLLIFCLKTNGQNCIVTYKHITSFNEATTEADYTLYIESNKKSIYYQESSKNYLNENSNSEVLERDIKTIPFVKKDYLKKEAIYNQPIINKIVHIKENLPLQRWKISEETKEVNSFICKKATTSFRGREYIAWFTEKHSLIGGPWKFDGLPGLVLQVSSKDGVLKINATNIELLADSVTVPKFKHEKLISWEEYKETYVNVINRFKKSMKASQEPDVEYDINLSLVEDIGL